MFEEQLQRLVEVVKDNKEEGVKVVPFYDGEAFNSANAFAQYWRGSIPESVIEAIEKGTVDAASEEGLFYQILKGQIENVQKPEIASAFLNYHALNEEDGEYRRSICGYKGS